MAHPASRPNIDLPKSTAMVQVSLIDSTARIKAPLGGLMGPHIQGHDFLTCPVFVFLVQHPSGRSIIFDLGIRKDWRNLAPKVTKMLNSPGWEVSVERNVADILAENNMDLSEVEAVVWSHWHYDHIGDMSTFPPTTMLVVGPDFRQRLLPTFPRNPDSSLLKSDLVDRELVEVNFDSSPRIGGFRAYDYFGDGSFYLLDAPGHAVGHMCGLARTTAPTTPSLSSSSAASSSSSSSSDTHSTFVLMGADTCHHGGEFRPTKYLPLPSIVFPSPLSFLPICPGSLFREIHRSQTGQEVFYEMTKNFPYNYAQAEQSVRNLEQMDAMDNVFVVISHDAALLDQKIQTPMYPKTINDWKARDLANKTRWIFLRDFQDAAMQKVRQSTFMQAGIVMDK